MPKRMLIDATHPEETRVVVADGNDLLEYDYETSTKRQIKSNIYLAKVTRVEPSLQAAFVDFGGNRHGFLAFNEIHPDYYQIPVEDREKLLAESDREDEEGGDSADASEADENGDGAESEDGDNDSGDEKVETVTDSDDEDIHELSDAHRRRLRKLTRSYKIQEVIKRRQILLVQVVKEERGNKGAALTTYLSLPGRYCVLMPNTSRGGGISRKISDPKHRKSMKKILSELDTPEGMAVIMRTAGVSRTKAEIKRDYEYLRRVWDDIRENTMNATAPALIYEEGDVIKRALRDIYDRDIDEVLVEGDEAYKMAKTLMRTMIPSHAKRVQPYEDETIPLFNRYQVDQQLDEIHDPVVQLKSGGYLVINPTEALVAIDVNSGRATRERNVEQTAYRTNLEAADEVARQLKLRDLAGLIVIDFIDMDVSRNNHAVERKLKEAMKSDRARVQIGRISPFGLLELSRQRLRPSIHEAHTQTCPVCQGAGFVRSTASTAMSILRELEEEGLRNRAKDVTVTAQNDIALYLLNQKRDALREIEERHELRVIVIADPEQAVSEYDVDFTRSENEDDEKEEKSTRGKRGGRETRDDDAPKRRRRRGRKRSDDDSDSNDADDESENETESNDEQDDTDEEGRKRGGRRRGRRGGRRRRRGNSDGDDQEKNEETSSDEEETSGSDEDSDSDGDSGDRDDSEETGGRRRRRRRRGRRGRGRSEDNETEANEDSQESESRSGNDDANDGNEEVDNEIDIPQPRANDDRDPESEDEPDDEADNDGSDDPSSSDEAEEPVASDSEPEDEAASDDAETSEEPEAAEKPDEEPEPEPEPEEEEEDDRPRRSGWWSRSTS